MTEQKKWFKNLDKCVECGTTERRHQGHGLCVNCYIRWLRKQNPEKSREINRRYEATDKRKEWRKKYESTEKYRQNMIERARKYRKSHKEICLERTQKWREENPDKGLTYRRSSEVMTRQRITTLIRKYGEAALQVLDRDNNTCQKCGKKDDPQLHHIDGNKKNNVIENMVVLCNRCHKTLHGWVPPHLRKMIFEMWMKLPLEETFVQLKNKNNST